MNFQRQMDEPLSSSWTLYYHAAREKRWTLDTFEPIGSAKTVREMLQIFHELGPKLKQGMYFCMRDPYPPLWENFQNIRGGSYSIRANTEDASDLYKLYVLGSMTGMATRNTADEITGITISPKLIQQGGQQKIGFFVIKIWNKDCQTHKNPANLNLLSSKLSATDVLYTPHVDKKM